MPFDLPIAQLLFAFGSMRCLIRTYKFDGALLLRTTDPASLHAVRVVWPLFQATYILTSMGIAYWGGMRGGPLVIYLNWLMLSGVITGTRVASNKLPTMRHNFWGELIWQTIDFSILLWGGFYSFGNPL